MQPQTPPEQTPARTNVTKNNRISRRNLPPFALIIVTFGIISAVSRITQAIVRGNMAVIMTAAAIAYIAYRTRKVLLHIHNNRPQEELHRSGGLLVVIVFAYLVQYATGVVAAIAAGNMVAQRGTPSKNTAHAIMEIASTLLLISTAIVYGMHFKAVPKDAAVLPSDEP